MGSANIAKPSQEGGGGQQRTGWGLSRLTQSPESPGASDPGQEGPLRCPGWGLGDSLAENFPRQGGPLLEAWLHCGEAWGYGFHILRCDLPFGDPSCLGLASGCPKSVLMEKLVMKALWGSSSWNVASCTVSALLTTLLVTTVWANLDETLESTVRL